MLLSWGRELQFVCLACLPIPDINAYPFFTFIFFYFMGYTYVEVYSLQELKCPCPPRGTWGSSSVVGLGVGKHLYPPGHLARPVPGVLIRIVSSLPAVSALGKLTNWTWHPLRAVWLSRQIRALSMILQTGTKWWRFFFHPVVNAKKWTTRCPYPNLKSFGENKCSPKEMLKREQKQRGGTWVGMSLVKPLSTWFEASWRSAIASPPQSTQWYASSLPGPSELCQPCPPCWIARSHSSK